MTGPEAAAKAAETLARAEDAALQGFDSAGPLCEVADGWRRLAETLEEHPRLEASPKAFVDGLTSQCEAIATRMECVGNRLAAQVAGSHGEAV